MKNKYLYRIKRITDGLYSTGGATPRWSKKGKAWSGLAALNNHLTLLMKGEYGGKGIKQYDGCIAEEYQIIEQPTGTIGLEFLISERESQHAADKAKYDAKHKAWVKAFHEKKCSNCSAVS